VQWQRAALAAVLCVGFTGCKDQDRAKVKTEEEAPRMATMLAVSDPRAQAQLVTGWYPLEQNAWRWTAGHFSVLLRPPQGADANGAVLKLKINVPEAILSKVKTTTLSASVGGTQLPPETYNKAGDYTYTQDVPASALKGESAKVDFSLTKFLPAGSLESRELGVIATSVGFEHK
jgi:hypothetical protein